MPGSGEEAWGFWWLVRRRKRHGGRAHRRQGDQAFGCNGTGIGQHPGLQQVRKVLPVIEQGVVVRIGIGAGGFVPRCGLAQNGQVLLRLERWQGFAGADDGNPHAQQKVQEEDGDKAPEHGGQL